MEGGERNEVGPPSCPHPPHEANTHTHTHTQAHSNSHHQQEGGEAATQRRRGRGAGGRGTTPAIASTKSLTGHCLGGAGVWEAIYSLIMMNGDFIAASANVETLDPGLDPGEIVTTMRDKVKIDSVLSNSFGFGGTNNALVFRRWNDE